MPHRSRELNDNALRFYRAILNRVPDSERQIDDSFLRGLAAIAKECGISGKELAQILDEDSHILGLGKKH